MFSWLGLGGKILRDGFLSCSYTGAILGFRVYGLRAVAGPEAASYCRQVVFPDACEFPKP